MNHMNIRCDTEPHDNPAHSSVLLQIRTYYMAFILMTSHGSTPIPPTVTYTKNKNQCHMLLFIAYPISLSCEFAHIT